ncbi:MAG: tetratricopeptide repeat protein [Caldilineaceae bacterium]
MRGQALKQLLLDAADELVGQYTRWHQGEVWRELLQVSYFSSTRLPVYRRIQILHTSEAAYYRNQNQAIEHLAQKVIDLVKPALRLEKVAPPTSLVGREKDLAQLLTSLQAGKAVGISGVGGVGKTTLGQAVAHHFTPEAIFWYTFKPGLNDSIRSLFFALAYFLHQQVVSTLWSQLVADRSEIKAGKEGVALKLLRNDLASLGERQVLLCFDEVDLLSPNEYEAHTQLLLLLESLRGQVPFLCIGQKPLIETDLSYTLNGLTLVDTATLLHQAGLALGQSQLARLYQNTQGNPRLLELFMALVLSLQREQAGETTATVIDNALANFPHAPSLEFLLHRIWRHLNPSEKYLLELLAVFRNPIPRAAWNDEAQQEVITQLLTWRLVQVDAQASIQLLPGVRAAIYQNLLINAEKGLLHREAAALRSQYGQFTAAAYHYAASGKAADAVNLLYTYKAQTIDQGQAEAALTVLLQIPASGLDKETQEKLILLRAELQKLLGQYEPARKTLQSIYWSIPFLSVQRCRLDADIAELCGEVNQVQHAYQTGLETIEKLLSESTYFHCGLGYLYTNNVEFERAQHEVERIRHDAANLEGVIYEMRGNLLGAETAYRAALELAQATQYTYGEANTQNNLGRVYGWRGQLVAAEAQLHPAIKFFRNTGHLNKLANATYNLALARRLAKKYRAALLPAEEALHWFIQLDETYGQAIAYELLAEIHLGLGNLEQAEQYARHVIEEEHTSSRPDGLRTLGEVYIHQGKLGEAEPLLRESLALAQATQDRILEAYALRALSALHNARADLPAAQKSLAQAQQIFRELGLTAEIE